MRACKKTAPFDPIWPRLALLAPFCSVGHFLASFCPVWLFLESFGTIWARLAPIGPTLPCLDTLQFWFQGTLRYQFAKVRDRIILIFVCYSHFKEKSKGYSFLGSKLTVSAFHISKFNQILLTYFTYLELYWQHLKGTKNTLHKPHNWFLALMSNFTS